MRHSLCRPFGPSGYQKEFPVLTDGATNFRSFGPKACLRLKLNHFHFVFIDSSTKAA